MLRATARRTSLLWILLFAGVLALTAPWGHPEQLERWLGRISVAIAASIAIPLTATFFHEFCHAFAAVATGNRVQALYAWLPIPLVHLKIGKAWLVVGRTIRGGMCQVFPRDPDRRPSAWVYAAGPLGNLILAGVFFAIWAGPTEGFWAEIWCLIAAGYNLYALGVNLWPRQASVVGTPMHTDGHVLYHRWQTRDEDHFDETSIAYGAGMIACEDLGRAELYLRRALARNPENRAAKDLLAFALYRAGRVDEAVPLWTALVDPGNPRLTAMAKNNLALASLTGASGRDLEKADRLSADALSREPSNAYFQSTRGLVEHELGRTKEGLKLIRSAYRNHVMPSSRGAAAAFLARVEVDRGDREEADRWLKKARRLGASRWLLTDVERRLELSPAKKRDAEKE